VVWRVPPPSDDAGPRRSTGLLAIFLVVAVVVGVWLVSGREPGTSTSVPETTSSQSAPGTDPESDLPLVELADLPSEAAETVALIDEGGPFPESQDGGVFGNLEGLLPDQERGYYREYTVETPGSDDRGARRIVSGAEDELYWTEDHYSSFERILR